MSSKSAAESTNQSFWVAEQLTRLLKNIFGPHAVTVSETAARKSAHFIEYLVLGCLMFMGFLDRSNYGRGIFFVFVAGLVFALSDEVHQIFVPGRTARFFDILIDMAGITVAVGAMWRMVIVKAKSPVV